MDKSALCNGITDCDMFDDELSCSKYVDMLPLCYTTSNCLALKRAFCDLH